MTNDLDQRPRPTTSVTYPRPRSFIKTHAVPHSGQAYGHGHGSRMGSADCLPKSTGNSTLGDGLPGESIRLNANDCESGLVLMGGIGSGTRERAKRKADSGTPWAAGWCFHHCSFTFLKPTNFGKDNDFLIFQFQSQLTNYFGKASMTLPTRLVCGRIAEWRPKAYGPSVCGTRRVAICGSVGPWKMPS